MMGYYRVLQSRNAVMGKCKECGNSGTLRKSRCRNIREKIIKHIFMFGYTDVKIADGEDLYSNINLLPIH